MHIILEYLYTFSINGINKGNIEKVFLAADFLGIDCLLVILQKEIANGSSIELFKAAFALDVSFRKLALIILVIQKLLLHQHHTSPLP